MLFGAHASFAGIEGQDSEQALGALETLLGVPLSLHRIFRLWDDPVQDWPMIHNVQHGRVPVVSYRPAVKGGSKIPWREISAGAHDGLLRRRVAFWKSLGGPVVVCLHHEPELASGYGIPPEYAAAVRRLRALCKGVPNVRLAFIASPVAYRDNGARAKEFWPGDDAVDWVGVNAYNWFGCLPGQEPEWVPLGNSCRSALSWATIRDKPLMVAEWGSVEDPKNPARKASWITAVGTWAGMNPRVQALSYLHARGSCPWWLDSSPESLEAFRKLARRFTAPKTAER